MSKKQINLKNVDISLGNSSQAIEVGNLLFVSGQIGMDNNTGTLSNTSVETEITQVMNNIGEILKEAGYTFKNIVKATIYLKEMSFYRDVNTIYGKYFTDNVYPARDLVIVKMLPKDANVEISVIAHK